MISKFEVLRNYNTWKKKNQQKQSSWKFSFQFSIIGK